MFPVIGPVFLILSVVILLIVVIVKQFKPESNAITTMIALVSCVETFAFMLNFVVTVY